MSLLLHGRIEDLEHRTNAPHSLLQIAKKVVGHITEKDTDPAIDCDNDSVVIEWPELHVYCELHGNNFEISHYFVDHSFVDREFSLDNLDEGITYLLTLL